MFLVLLIFFDSEGGWRRAATSGKSVLRTFFLHLFPMLLVGCVAEGYGILHWGKPIGNFGARRTYPLEQVLPLEACHFAAGLVVVLICAWVLGALADTFKQRQKFSQKLVVSVFSLGPIFLMRMADAFPAVNPWLSWGIGAFLVATLLYQGLPRVFHLDPAHALGVYLSASVLVILISCLSRVLILLVVQPRLLVADLG